MAHRHLDESLGGESGADFRRGASHSTFLPSNPEIPLACVDPPFCARAQVNNRGLQIWLHGKWTKFFEEQKEQKQKGRLYDFLNVLRTSGTEDFFVPMPGFRQLSPNNPYLKTAGGRSSQGFTIEIEPTKVGLQLMAVREDLAGVWVQHLERISTLTEPSSNRTQASMAHTISNAAADSQMLRSVATKVAVREMLSDIAHLPSQKEKHEWLSTFVLVTHAKSLTREGDVEVMIQAIGTQPLHIRGKALVDPMEIQRDLLKRTAQVSEKFGKALPETVATEHATMQTSFLETCLRITNS